MRRSFRFYRVGRDIRKNTVDLLLKEGRRHPHRRLHSGRVLRGQRGDRCHRVHAVHGHGLQVRLDTGAAAAVASGNGYGCFSFILLCL